LVRTPSNDGPSASVDHAPDGSARVLMPPYIEQQGFLEEDLVTQIITHVAASESEFVPTGISFESHNVNPSVRSSACLPGIRNLRKLLKAKILAIVPSLITALRVTPFEPSGVEIELVAHGDGGFYKPHIDTFTGKDEKISKQRLLSAVYYFHTEPKAYSGGELRLHAFGSADKENAFVDIKPTRNTLIAFPSWASHEVRPVKCSSKRFMDSRFSINMWVKRDRLEART